MRIAKLFLFVIVMNFSLMAVVYVAAQQNEDDKASPIDVHRIPETRGMRFVVADKWDKTQLTFKILNCPATLDCASAQNAIRKAFTDWQAVSGLSFSETGGSADIELSFTLNDPEFGTEGDVLAFAYFPSDGGDVFFDDAEQWSLFDGSDLDFYVVALHEIGHALGLDHSDDPSAVMYAYSGTAATLQRDDILAIQRLYGTPTDGGTGDTTNPPVDPTPLPTPEILPPVEDDGGVVVEDGDIQEELGYEEWVVYAEAGETLTITMESAQLDSYLILLSPDYSVVLAEDDDSLGDYNAVITYTFSETGDYIVIATTYDGWISGDYALNVYADGGDFSDENTTDDQNTDDQTTDDNMTDYTGSFVFGVYNSTGDDICGVYISSSYAEDWGGNLVDVLSDGGSIAIELPADDYDVYVHDCYEGGMEWQEYYIQLTSNLTYVVTMDGGYVSK